MASQTATTVSTILQMISDARGETTTNTDAVRIRAVSRAERDFAKRKFWRTHLLIQSSNVAPTTGNGTTTSFVVGTTTYPFRMKGLAEVFVGGTAEENRYQIVDYMVFTNLVNRDSAARICTEWYDVVSDVWYVTINPVPANGDAIYVSYFWEPPTRTSTSDTVVCPSMDIIFRLALAYIYEGEDEEKYKEQLAIAEALIDELTGLENTPSVNQLYTVGAIENSVKSQGMGTY